MTHARRNFLLAGGASVLAYATYALTRSPFDDPLAGVVPGAHAAEPTSYEVSYADEEWRKRLDPNQYAVLRHESTERPYSSPLNNEHRAGRFACAGCALELFSSATKFDSHTGWPSFYQPLDNAVLEKRDTMLGVTRTEIHCRRCGGHLGHVFKDGPKPTGLRYCMNGVALSFLPQSA